MTSEMSAGQRTVAVLLDPDSRAPILALADRVNVWVIESVPNRATAQEVWQRRITQELGLSMTVFLADASEPERVVAEKLETIDLHHDERSQVLAWNHLEVHGARPEAALRDALATFGS
jgi:hypothetical protein